MAPVPVDSLVPEIVQNVQNGLLQPHPGMPMPNTNLPPANLDAEDVLVAIVGVALVASISIFIVVKTISVIKNYVQGRILERKVRRGEAIGFKYPYGYRDYKTMRSGSGSGPAYNHRCKFTLSPDGNNSDSDTSSTITRSSRSSSSSTIVSGRICVVYDDTIPSNKPRNHPPFNSDLQF